MVLEKLLGFVESGLLVKTVLAKRSIEDIALAIEEYGDSAYKHLNYKTAAGLESLLSRNIDKKLRKGEKWVPYLLGIEYKYPMICRVGKNDIDEKGISKEKYYQLYSSLCKRHEAGNIVICSEWLDSFSAFRDWYLEHGNSGNIHCSGDEFSSETCYFSESKK